MSIGIVVQDGAHADFAGMYRDADAALYQEREDGKSRIGVFKPSLDDAVGLFRSRASLEAEILLLRHQSMFCDENLPSEWPLLTLTA